MMLTLAILLPTGCTNQAGKSEISSKEVGEKTPVIIHLDGLRFKGTDKAVVNEILHNIQEKAPQRVRFELADNEEEVRKQNPYAMVLVSYKEEPAGSYYLDDQGCYRLGEARYCPYIGTRITCTISVDGKLRWVEAQKSYDRDLYNQKIIISAATSEYLTTDSDKEPEIQLRENAVTNLWSKLVQFPTFFDSVIRSRPQFESNPFEAPDEFGTVYGGIIGQSGPHTLLVNPWLETIPPGPIPFNELSIVEVAGNKVYLCYPGTEVGYYCVDTVTGSTWEFIAPQIGYWDMLTKRMRVVEVRDGTAYIFYSDKIYALDADSGNKKWEHKYVYDGGDLMPDCPVIGEQYLYYGYRGGPRLAPCLVAVDLANGLQKWASPTASALAWGPKVYAGRVYAIQGNKLVVFDGNTGEIVWSQQCQQETTGSFWYWWNWAVNLEAGCEPLVASGTVFAVQCYGYDDTARLQAYDAETGALKWQSSLAAPDDSLAEPPRFYQIMEPIGGIVPVNYDYAVVAYDIDTGRKLWTFAKQNSAGFVRATATQNTIFVNDGGILRALDASAGSQKWAFQCELNVDKAKGPAYSYYPIWSQGFSWAANGMVYIPYERYNEIPGIAALDENTGKEEWRCFTGSIFDVSEGLIYMGANLGDYRTVTGSNYNLWVVDAIMGQVKTYLPLTGLFGKVVDGTIYITARQAVPSKEKERWLWYLQVIKPTGS
jgi:outer membrane protein assembly factor BamB